MVENLFKEIMKILLDDFWFFNVYKLDIFFFFISYIYLWSFVGNYYIYK